MITTAAGVAMALELAVVGLAGEDLAQVLRVLRLPGVLQADDGQRRGHPSVMVRRKAGRRGRRVFEFRTHQGDAFGDAAKSIKLI